MTEKDLLYENKELKNTIDKLKQRITILERMVGIFESNSRKQGVRGESMITKLLNGEMTTYNTPYDIVLKHNGLLLEVKFSGVYRSVRNQITNRWAWSNVFGHSGNKRYDRLILIGEKDSRYYQKYIDTECPYIFFDVPFKEIMPLTILTSLMGDSGKNRSIQLTTNPMRGWSSAKPLFLKFQTSLAELERKYVSN